MSVKNLGESLYRFTRPSRWTNGIGTELPQAYKKFWKEWKIQKPVAVHYIPKEGLFERKDDGTILPIQNVPLPLKYPPEMHDGIWGGEAVVQGFVKKSKYRRRVPKFWVPDVQRSILYSEVLNTYMRTVVTNRTINLIHENYGFDHYLLKTPACDLVTLMAVTVKRNILLALADKTLYPDDPVKREEVYEKYKQYLEPYTREDIEWYGLSFKDACKKWIKEKQAKVEIKPLKLQYRAELIEQLRSGLDAQEPEVSASGSWISKMNPFSKSLKP